MSTTFCKSLALRDSFARLANASAMIRGLSPYHTPRKSAPLSEHYDSLPSSISWRQSLMGVAEQSLLPRSKLVELERLRPRAPLSTKLGRSSLAFSTMSLPACQRWRHGLA